MTKPVAWIREHRADDGEITFRVGRADGELVADWPGVARMYATSAETARWEVDPEADDDLIEKIQHGMARALLRHLRGGLGVHAAAASMNGRAIACIGPSGTGKSTLMADFCRRFGAGLCSDDIACLELIGDEVLLLPGERRHWVEPKAARAMGFGIDADVEDDDKCAVAPERIADAPSRLVACVSLVFDDTVTAPQMRAVQGLDAVGMLVPSLARFALDDPGAHVRESEQLALVTKRVRLLELRRPRNLHALKDSSETLLRLLQEEPHP